MASLFVCVLLLVAGLPASRAQITLDGSMGPAGPLAGPDYRIDAGVGQMRGSNLFHSFAEFNVRAGESATFRGPGPVDNIIGRVTGGHPSVVDGRVRSEIPDANVYLLNPRGVVFGPDASLEIDGSFHVSTADYLRFADGGAFYADPAKTGVLSVAPPEAFGFLGETPAGIAVRGGQLGVPGDKTLSVIGGNVRVEGGMVSAPG
ncbi:MAG: filamentous hemagglutinin N-terminal domain-containing protein, partial [Thermodesulfobacteriota bacterium]